MSELRISPLDAEHRALAAHMGEFAGWDMPISYSGTVGEHSAVRTAAGVFDVSHLGKIWIRGARAREVVDRALTNRFDNLEPGRARYTLMLNERAGIVDDMIVYGFDDDLLVVPNAANVDEVERRLRPHGDGATIEQSSDAIIALQGPHSRRVLDEILPGVPPLEYMHCVRTGRFLVCRSGYTGEHGYEIFCAPDDAPGIWKSIVDAGVTPCGLAARDTLRLEMGYPLHGNDIDARTMPSEAGLMWAVGKSKQAFDGRDVLVSTPPKRMLAGINMTDRVIPRRECDVYKDGERIGTCTSGTFSPTLKIGIALASCTIDSIGDGDGVEIDVRGKRGRGIVVKPPFVGSSPK